MKNARERERAILDICETMQLHIRGLSSGIEMLARDCPHGSVIYELGRAGGFADSARAHIESVAHTVRVAIERDEAIDALDQRLATREGTN